MAVVSPHCSHTCSSKGIQSIEDCIRPELGWEKTSHRIKKEVMQGGERVLEKKPVVEPCSKGTAMETQGNPKEKSMVS